MRALLLFGLLPLGLMLAGCVPVTLDNDPPVDFKRWQAVYVAPIPGADADSEREFVEGLRADSGFKTVTTDGGARVDAVLYVTVDVSESYDDEDDEYEYTATARVRLESALDGRVIDSTEVNDDGGSRSGAVDDALDEVVQHFLRSYRL